MVQGQPFSLERSSQRHKLPRRRQVELQKNPDDAFTVRDLIEALGWHSHLAGVNNDLGDYWLGRALSLRRLYSVGLKVD